MDKKEMGGITFNAPVTVGTFVKVESGATYIKNNLPGVTAFSDQEEERKEVEEVKASKLEMALQAIASLALEGAFKPQKNYIAAYRIVEERYAKGIETSEFCRLMEKKTSLPAELLPKNDNIRKIYYERKPDYPNWSFPQEGAEWTQDMTDLATRILQRINKTE